MIENLNHTIPDLINGDQKVFELIFKELYSPLYNLANGILQSEELAEEQVQEVFMKLWERRSSLPQNLNLFPYLLTSVRNQCYNYLKHLKVEQRYFDAAQQELQDNIFSKISYDDVDEEMILKVHATIDRLPEKCKEVFILSRFRNLSHKEISEELGISTKTIENHITKAMKFLKHEFGVAVIILVLLLGEL